ncbi:unnamed protein product [Tilletia caries]|uniref:Ribosomal protein L10e/L16 domain-containing protein n=1 Tax=Tilletia caries TaxID=13290 RepID=A0ABN7ISG5_9BASI|nr:unnamed protein product [Tilletia caries]CAD6915350.1 unnamed protein product [Tilletia caries]CAD7060754.1 unnamed protein product [Tilletia caries]
MMTSITRALGSLTLPSAGSSSIHALRSASSRPRIAATTPSLRHSAPFSLLAANTRPRPCSLRLTLTHTTIRHKGNLAPRRVKYRKAHKGRIPVKTGGSTKGTTVQQGTYGIRVLEPARLTAKQLQSAETALKRRLKVIKGAQVYLRVFPDIPVCVKGNETRMGKGKGAFEFWACPLRLASAKLPVRTEFVSLQSNPRLGSILIERDDQPAAAVLASSLPPATATAAVAAVLGKSATVAEVPLAMGGSPVGSGQL